MADSGQLREDVKEILELLKPAKLNGKIATARHSSSINGMSIFDDVSSETRSKIMLAAKASGVKLDRCMGCMVGMAVADSLGHLWEFVDVVDEVGSSGQYFDLKTFKAHNVANQFQLKPGQWTDDCSMGLCIADSFIVRGGFDGSDMRLRFWHWWENGMNNAFRKDPTRSDSVGLGGNISKSLFCIPEGTQYVPNTQPKPVFQVSGEDAGNGSLMRNAAVPIFAHNDLEMGMDIARRQSYTTHPGPMASEACAFLTYACFQALNADASAAQNPREFLEEAVTSYLNNVLPSVEAAAKSDSARGACKKMARLLTSAEPDSGKERNWNWKSASLDIEATLQRRGSQYNGYPVSAGYYGSFCMDGLAVALWCVYNTTNFNDAIVRCVNFLGDADTIGAICAQLAGAIYGYSAIDERFLNWLKKWDDDEVALRAIVLHELGVTASQGTASSMASAGYA